MLGRTGKCPKCGHRFVLQEPDDVPLELAEPSVTPPAPTPQMGAAGRWIPDEISETGSADRGMRKPVSVETGPSEIVASGKEAADIEVPVFVPQVPETESTVASRVRRRRKSNPSRIMVFGVLFAVVMGTIAGGILLNRSENSGGDKTVRTPPQANPAWEAEQREFAASNDSAASLSPTDGEQIPLDLIPFTPHLLLHLRPAELWQQDRQLNEFHALLSTLSIWLKSRVEEISKFKAEEIEELTFAVNFGARSTAPEISAVVRLKDEQLPGDLIQRFKGSVRTDLQENVREAGDRSYLIADNRTFAIAPSSLSVELSDARQNPATIPPDLEPLLNQTDRTRHVTLLFDLNSIDVHREYVLTRELQPLAAEFVSWMGKETDGVSWSMHLKPNLFIETLIRPTNDSTPVKVQRAFLSRLDKLPEQLFSLAQKMRPSTDGARQMIGRFPAMMKAFQVGTSADVSPLYVRLVTILPPKAASNIAAASLLTWNQSLTTDLSAGADAAGADSKLPEKISDRLNMPVLIDFRNFPLQEAMAYISDVIKTEIIIDGDALKAAGFTQNMNQTFNLGTVPAKTAIHAILQQYAAERDPMVISVDEARRRIILGTKSKAEQDGLPIFDTSPTE